LESAGAVCSDGTQANVLDQIAGLVQKSMVVAERIDGSTSRYRLLESQLAYGEGRLGESTELERIRRRHYEYFREGLSAKTTTEHAGRRLRAGSRPGFIEAQWIARESGNLWAAMRWARNNADDLGLGLAADLAILRMGDLPQLRSLLEELLQRSRGRGGLAFTH
jgi:predicted ATPase